MAEDSHNLTRDEAQARARLLDVQSYRVHLDLADSHTAATFRSVSEVRFDCREPGASTFIEIAAERINSATINGEAIDTSGWTQAAGLPLTDLPARAVLVVDADIAFSASGRGLTRAIDPADGNCYLHTSFEPADAQHTFACFDQPDLKAEITWSATVPADWKVVANTKAAGVDEHGDTKTVTFDPSPKMSTYISALCAGPFYEIRDSHDGIDIGIFTTASLAKYVEAEEIFLLTKQCLDFFHREFAMRYPLDKYDHVFAPGFSAGAMENLGCVVYAEQYFIHRSAITDVERMRLAYVLAHEMAHMWFGDIVTMRWWDDLWLNESFATWAGYTAVERSTRFTAAWTSFVEQKDAAYKADQLPSTHPVCADAPDVATAMSNFDAITYPKGASVIKQLVAYVGEDNFRTGLQAYFVEHAYGNTTFADLLRHVGSASGRDLRNFAAEWLDTPQVNTLTPDVALADDGSYSSVVIRQTAPAGYPTLRSHRLVVGCYNLVDDDPAAALDGGEGPRLVRTERVELEVSGEATEVTALKGKPAAALLLVNDEDLSYAKNGFDPGSMATLVRHLGDFVEAMPRALCYRATAHLLRDGVLPARQYVQMVANALGRETDVIIIHTSTEKAVGALEMFADPAWAPHGWRRLADAAYSALQAADPLSGRQLAFARAYITAANDDTDFDRLSDWLGGRNLPEGLTLDEALRWSIVSVLAAFGKVGPAEIDEELARDRNSQTEDLAAAAQAMVPTPQAKAAAWAMLTGEEDPPILRQRAVSAVLHHRAALAASQAQRDDYFATLDQIWQRRATGQAIEYTYSAFPGLQVDEATVAAAENWLAGEGHHPVARKIVADQLDQVQRAIRARRTDAAAG
jgi:aminopeptidase N